MKINKLVLVGNEYKRTIQFNDGLTIISGEKTSGKSLILTLINYCLGSSSAIPQRVQYQLFANIKDVYLEILIDGNWLTIKRSLVIKKQSFDVYHCRFENKDDYLPERLKRNEFLDFLVDKLGTFVIKKSKNKAHTNEYTSENVSFRDMFRYCYITQDQLGSKSFLSYTEPFKRNKNPYAFEMITDLVDRSHNELEKRTIDLKNNLNDCKAKFSGLKVYLSQRNVDSRMATLKELRVIEKNIGKLYEKRKFLIESSNDNDFKRDNNRINSLINDVRQLEEKIDQLKKKQYQIELSIQSSQMLIDDYKQELNDLKVTQIINYDLTLKNQKMVCPLCQSVLQNNDKTSSSSNVSTVVNHVNKKIRLINDKLIREKERKKTIINEVNSDSKRMKLLKKILDESNSEKLLPALSDLETVNKELIVEAKNKESLDEVIRVFNKQDQLQKDITKIQKEMNDNENEISARRGKKDGLKRKTLIDINESYRRLLKHMKYNDLSGTRIDEKNYIPFFNNSSVYDHQSGGLRECVQLSYILSIAQSKYSKFFPGFLMLDSIGKYVGTNEIANAELDAVRNEDPEVYKEIFEQFIIAQRNIQLIIVENTPPTRVKEYVRYKFSNGQHGLIDFDENEK